MSTVANRLDMPDHGGELGKIVPRLLASDHPCDQRKGRDLRQLLHLSRGRWRGHLRIVGLRTYAHNQSALLCELRAKGLIWCNGRPTSHERFILTIRMPHHYPLFAPTVHFLDPVPWCAHVLHRECVPEEDALPPGVREFLRHGAHGSCCYIGSGVWTPDAQRYNLATVVRQVSCLLTLSHFHGEAQGLNPAARDHTLRLANEDCLPVGEPLPYPDDRRDGVLDMSATGGAEDNDVLLVEETPRCEAGAGEAQP